MQMAYQPIMETDEFIQIKIHEPYWGAWKKYGWPKGIEGFGVSDKLVRYAFEKKKHIRVANKYGKYEIPPVRIYREAKKWNSSYLARSGVKLMVIPRNAFKRISKEKELLSFCRACEKPLPQGKYFCNEECQEKYWGKTAKEHKRWTLKQMQAKCKEWAIRAKG